MGLRRSARRHDTEAARKQGAHTEQWWEHRPNDRVLTIDGPGRVLAVHDGPLPGAEEYEIALDGGLGGGRYSPGQITASAPTTASAVEAAGHHLASEDYEELREVLFSRPDPATLRYTAAVIDDNGLLPAAPQVDDGEGLVMQDASQYHASPVGDFSLASRHEGARAFDHYHPNQVYLRFGHWPDNERSQNNVTGMPEDGVSVYDLDHRGEPMDPDADFGRMHHHDEHCERDCDLDSWNEDYGNDTGEEMQGRVQRAEKNRRRGHDIAGETGHLVTGDHEGFGHDGEPLLRNVRRVGDWIDHRHVFVPGAEPHHLARDPRDEDYEEPVELPHQEPLFHAVAAHEPEPQGEDFDESDMCAVGHEGGCPGAHGEDDLTPRESARREVLRRWAMPSRNYPEHPDGFRTEIEGTSYNKRLVGYIGDTEVGHIEHSSYSRDGGYTDDPQEAHGVKVHMLHTYGGRSQGAASAMMDHLYAHYPHAWINHGYRTTQGLRWWNSYEEPDPHRNVHNVPSYEWGHMFDAGDVASDIDRNEGNDPGHHSRHHDVSWIEDHGHGSSRTYCENCAEDDHNESDHPWCSECDDHISGFDAEEHEREEHAPKPADPTETGLHHGRAVFLSPEGHRIVHNDRLPTRDRAHRLLSEMGRGDMPAHGWHADEDNAAQDAVRSYNTNHGRGGAVPTRVVLHANPFAHDEVHDEDGDPIFKHGDDGQVHFDPAHQPINFELKGVTWGNRNGGMRGGSTHEFYGTDTAEVGMSLRQHPWQMYSDEDGNAVAHQPNQLQERREIRERHEQRYREPESHRPPPGTGEQMKLFSSLPSVLSHLVLGPEPEGRAELARHLMDHHGLTPAQLADLPDPGQGDALEYAHNGEHLDHDGIGGTDFGMGEAHDSKTEHTHDDKAETHGGRWVQETNPLMRWDSTGISSLNMLATAALDESFRFHVTAAWRDVRDKAVRIRRSGGVSITHVSDGLIVASVKGDHDVYETGLQRYPGRRQSVAVYSCGCKWGAYHWGAEDDMSRFAGRMCSHALALQYEAQSRGMFGRDIEVDDAKPRWVPSKVVVKYDIDSGTNIRAQSARTSVPEQAPLMVALAFAEDGDPALGAVIAAVNDLFGDSSGYSEPSLMSPQGPTGPWNTEENPASAGVLSAGDPRNWGSITEPGMLPRLSSVMRTEAFWQALVPLVRAVAPSVIKAVTPAVKRAAPAAIDYGARKLVDKLDQVTTRPAEGAEALLNDEPEGALPETDGGEHTASLGDVDIVNSHDVSSLADDALSPENPSIQTQGSTADIVAEFQRSAAASSLMNSDPKGGGDGMDLAAAAQAYLTKTAADFTLAEREALINESPGTQAANTDRLDIEGTHYAEIQKRIDDGDDDGRDDDLWLMM